MHEHAGPSPDQPRKPDASTGGAALPAFKWPTVGGFVLGLVESALNSAFVGLVYVPIHNALARRWRTTLEHIAQRLPPPTRRGTFAAANARMTATAQCTSHTMTMIPRGWDMHRSSTRRHTRRNPATSTLIALALVGLFGLPGNAAAQGAHPKPAKEEGELPHPFLTHMGVPEGVGVFALRVSGLTTRANGKSTGDFGFHLETGLTKTIGLHIRNDAFRTNSHTEAMFQFAAIMSKDGMSGFAPLIEFEFPTRSGAGSRIESLVGFTTALVNSRVSFNQVFHYNPREDAVEGSAALVARVATGVFPVVEVLGAGGSGAAAAIGLLVGLKAQVREGINLGLAYQFPLSNRRDFASRVMVQPEFEWGKM